MIHALSAASTSSNARLLGEDLNVLNRVHKLDRFDEQLVSLTCFVVIISLLHPSAIENRDNASEYCDYVAHD